MSAIRTITAADFADDCPVPVPLVARLASADADALSDLLDAIPEARRARLAVWLYGRSHTHELGVRVAAACDGTALRREAGHVGSVLHDLSRRPYAAPSYGARSTTRRVSLGGSHHRAGQAMA